MAQARQVRARQPRARQRPPTSRQEYRRLKKQQEKMRRIKEREAWEAARGPIDLPFFLLAMVLLTIGLIMLLSASFPSAQASKDSGYNPLYYFQRQAMWAGIGLAAMVIISKINYHRFEVPSKYALLFSIALLILVILPGPKANGKLLGITHNNATRWLGIPGMGSMQFQPSEVAKVGLIVFFAHSISMKREKMKTFREGFLYHVSILAVICVLILVEPHFSGAVLIFGIGASMLVVGGIHWGWIAAGLTAVGGAGYLVLFTDLMQKIGYNAARITVWREPFGGDLDFQRKYAWQTTQSLITIGSGGLLGVGLGKSRQKFMFLPEEHNDFIFAVVLEELGLVGGGLIMLLFMLLILRGFWLAINARDRFGSLLVVGVTVQIALQTFLNMAVVTNLIPNTGISLPFFSYGGTALAIQLAEVGMVLAVSRQMPAPKAE